MTSLYSCRHDGDQYRITKLSPELEVESSYLCSAVECECPGFERSGHCRHLKMLPRFISHEACDGMLLLNFDTKQWSRHPLALPEGIVMVGLDDPATLFNTIAEAVGEPQLSPKPWRRY